MRIPPALMLTLIVTTAACCANGPKVTAPPSSFKNWAVAYARSGNIYAARADGSAQKLIIKNAGTPSYSPDKRELAFYRDGNIWVSDSSGHKQRKITHYGKGHKCPDEDVRIAWNPRDGWITFSMPGFIKTVNEATGITTRIPGASILEVNPAAKSPAPFARFDISDSGTGFNFANNENPAWARSGQNLAFTRNGDIWMTDYVPAVEQDERAGWDIWRFKEVASYDSPTYRASRWNTGVTSLSWSPNGKHLAYTLSRLGGTGTAELHVITLKTTQTSTIHAASDSTLLTEFSPSPTQWEAFQPEHVCFSPDGRWVAFSSIKGTFAVSIDGLKVVKLIAGARQLVW